MYSFVWITHLFLGTVFVSVALVYSRFTCKFLNDKCFKPLDYSIYPRCIIRTMVSPSITCEEEMQDEFTVIEEPGTVTGIVFECYANEPLEMEFDGFKPMSKAIVFPCSRNLSQIEYGINFGYLKVDRKIAGKYSFFKVGNRSLEKSFYVYYRERSQPRQRKFMSPFIFQDPLPYQQNKNSANYTIPCRPFDKSTNVRIIKEGQDVTDANWISYDPQVGFVINTSHIEAKKPWGLYQCTSGDIKLIVNLSKMSDGDKPLTSDVTTTNSKYCNLHWNINGSNMNCGIKLKNASPGVIYPLGNSREINLVNIKSLTPIETKLKYQCKEQEECLNVDLKQSGYHIPCVDEETNHTTTCSTISNYFPSGLLVCSCEDGREEMAIEYFTGLDNQFYPYSLLQNKTEVVIGITLIDNNIVSFSPNSLYVNWTYTFECTTVLYGLAAPIIWYTQENDEEFQIYDSETYSYIPLTEKLSKMETREDFLMTSNLSAIMCAVRIWNSTSFLNTTYILPKQKLTETGPSFKTKFEDWTFYIGEQSKYLRCRVEGSPEPAIEWNKNGKKIIDKNVSITKGNHSSTLAFSVVETTHAGNYSCTARNSKDTNVKTFMLNIKERPSYAFTIGISVFSLILVSVGFISLGIFYHKRRLQTILTKSEIDDFLNGNEYATLSNYETAFAVHAYNKQFEVAKRDMIIFRDKILGLGQFGVVYKGTVHGEDVAIKTTKKDCDKLYVKALLAEVKIMIHIGEHRNIVSLVGASTKDMWKGEVYLAMPLFSSGNLQTHLRKCHRFIPFKIDGTSNEIMNDYRNLKEMICITTKDLWKWSYQIANGMAHLTGKNVIHGDLATRNILLCDDYNAKISDFGLSKKLYEMEIYTKTSKDPVPWRWMSIEALEFMEFSIKSDVWSFGVTMWEIFSMGAIPYPGVNWSDDFLEHLRKGLRLTKPRHACDNIYDVMTSCWHENAEQRESFSALSDYLYKKIVEMPADPLSNVSYL